MKLVIGQVKTCEEYGVKFLTKTKNHRYCKESCKLEAAEKRRKAMEHKKQREQEQLREREAAKRNVPYREAQMAETKEMYAHVDVEGFYRRLEK